MRSDFSLKTPLFTWKWTKSSGRSHKEVRDKRKELGSSLNTCQGYDIQRKEHLSVKVTK